LRLSAASLERVLEGQGFRTFASKAENGFVGAQICFVGREVTKQLPAVAVALISAAMAD
jgi:hypothetical protein